MQSLKGRLLVAIVDVVSIAVTFAVLVWAWERVAKGRIATSSLCLYQRNEPGA